MTRWPFLLTLILFSCILCSNGESTARGLFLEENFYLSIGAGEFQCRGFKETEDAYAKKNIKLSHTFNAGIGYRFSDHIRSDVLFQYDNVKYRANSQGFLYRQKIRALSGMMNLYYDMLPQEFISPYLLGGAGISKTSPTPLVIMPQNETHKGKPRTNLAWNIGAGVLINTLSKDYAATIGYKYIDLGKIKTAGYNSQNTNSATQKIRGHQVMATLLYKL